MMERIRTQAVEQQWPSSMSSLNTVTRFCIQWLTYLDYLDANDDDYDDKWCPWRVIPLEKVFVVKPDDATQITASNKINTKYSNLGFFRTNQFFSNVYCTDLCGANRIFSKVTFEENVTPFIFKPQTFILI